MGEIFFEAIFRNNKNTVRLCVLFFALITGIRSSAQKVEIFAYDCVTPGQNITIDAFISNADTMMYYRWQYKTLIADWVCFREGMNTINGVNFLVTGASGTGVNDAPQLTIYNASSELEDMMVRIAIAPSADPCSYPAPAQIWGTDDMAPQQTKYLRLHIYTNGAACPPYAYQCSGNMLLSSGNYYGGFEQINFDPASLTYTRNNFGLNKASSDYIFGSGPGSYQDINNPHAMSTRFTRNIAPHTGNYQLVVEGSADNSQKAWYKTVSLVAGRQYSFAVWVARIDSTDPHIELRANSNILYSKDLSQQPIGKWNLFRGTYTATLSGIVNFSVVDVKAGGKNNYALDDICLRECANCSILELHQFRLNAVISGNEVKLSWVAENEMGTANFIVERAFDEVNFNAVGSKLPDGPVNTPTTYHFTDDIQNTGVHPTLYYRIKALDVGGRYAYSNVVLVRRSNQLNIQAWPIPFTDQLNFAYYSGAISKILVSVVNNSGAVIRQSHFNVTRGNNQLLLTDMETLPQGIFYLRITDKNSHETITQKISK